MRSSRRRASNRCSSRSKGRPASRGARASRRRSACLACASSPCSSARSRATLRLEPFSRLFSLKGSQNVVAAIQPRGETRRTLVLVSHLDSSRSGLLFHPSVSPHLRKLTALVSAAVVARALTPHLPARFARSPTARRPPSSPAGLALLAERELRGVDVPGANDNASGVAAATAIARELAAGSARVDPRHLPRHRLRGVRHGRHALVPRVPPRRVGRLALPQPRRRRCARDAPLPTARGSQPHLRRGSRAHSESAKPSPGTGRTSASSPPRASSASPTTPLPSWHERDARSPLARRTRPSRTITRRMMFPRRLIPASSPARSRPFASSRRRSTGERPTPAAV